MLNVKDDISSLSMPLGVCLFSLFCEGCPTLCVNSSVCQLQNGREKSSTRQPSSRPRRWISAWCGSCSRPFSPTATAASRGNSIPSYQTQYMTAVSMFAFNYCFNKGQAFVHTEMTGRYCCTQTHLALPAWYLMNNK